MTTLFLFISVLSGVCTCIAIILFFLSVSFKETCYWFLLSAVGFGVLSGIFLDCYIGNIKQESKEIVITTSMPAKIYTTIIIKNGVSDTSYTYYLMARFGLEW